MIDYSSFWEGSFRLVERRRCISIANKSNSKQGTSNMEPPQLHTWGIIKESTKVLTSRPKLFVYLALTLILPLCSIVLISNLTILHIDHAQNHYSLQNTTTISFLLLPYVIFVAAFSLLSTAAIVYTVACIFTTRAVTYKQILKVLPKVWKRLLFTFLWTSLIVIGLTAAFVAASLLIILVFMPHQHILFLLLWWILALYVFAVFFHFNCVFFLATVVSVLEENYGLQAIRRSTHLIKGRRLVAYILYAFVQILYIVIAVGFGVSTYEDDRRSIILALRILLGIVCALLLSFVGLFGTVLFTIFYFSCKAFHHENIDMLALSEHLGAYTQQYITLGAASIQMDSMQQV